jgi:hypothetical protein
MIPTFQRFMLPPSSEGDLDLERIYILLRLTHNISTFSEMKVADHNGNGKGKSKVIPALCN